MEKFWLNFVLEFPGTCNRCPYQACACEFKYETFCNRCPYWILHILHIASIACCIYCILHIFLFVYIHIRLVRVNSSMKLFAPFVTVVFGLTNSSVARNENSDFIPVISVSKGFPYSCGNTFTVYFNLRDNADL